jgi:RNA polymerase sigma factor (sigma-70 family)
MVSDPAALVEKYLPLARGLAARWALNHPNLAEDFESDALLALFRAALAFIQISEHTNAFVQFARRRIVWMLKNRVQQVCRARCDRRREVRLPPLLDGSDALDHFAGDEPEPCITVELREVCSTLREGIEQAGLTARERDVVLRVIGGGETAVRLASELGVSRARVAQIAAAALAKVRAAIDAEQLVDVDAVGGVLASTDREV